MTRLVFGDLVANIRVWIGAFLVIVVVAVSTTFAVAVAQTGFAVFDLDPAVIVRQSGIPDVPPDLYGDVAQLFVAAFVTVAAFVVLFVGVTSIAVLGSTIRLTVSLQRRSYAMWQIVGIMPRTAVAIVRWQLVLVAVVAACLGTALGVVVALPLLDWGLGAIDTLPQVPAHFDVSGAVVAVVTVVVIAWLGVLRPSRRVGRVDALEALRGPADTDARMTVLRWLSGTAATGLAVQAIASIRTATTDDAASIGLTVVVFTVLVVVVTSPLVVPWLTRTWTSLVPASLSSSWFLARTTAEYDLGRSASTVLSVMLAIAVPGGIWGAISTVTSVAPEPAGGDDSGIGGFALILAGPLLIALTGATASVLMSSGARDRELALIRSAGGSDQVVMRTAFLEALIHVVTGAVLAAGVLVLVTGSIWVALLGEHPEVRPDFGLAVAAPIAVAALVMLSVAALVPTARSIRQRLVPQLMEA